MELLREEDIIQKNYIHTNSLTDSDFLLNMVKKIPAC